MKAKHRKVKVKVKRERKPAGPDPQAWAHNDQKWLNKHDPYRGQPAERKNNDGWFFVGGGFFG
jgi:hypothetical protein